MWQKLERRVFSVHAGLIRAVFPGMYPRGNSYVRNEAFYFLLILGFSGVFYRLCSYSWERIASERRQSN
jgi:hypothetical protein